MFSNGFEPYLIQGNDNPDANETSANTSWLSRQLTWRHQDCVFHKNNYEHNFIKHNTHRNTEPTETTDDKPTDDPTPVITATLPYIRGTSETIAWITHFYTWFQGDVKELLRTQTNLWQWPPSVSVLHGPTVSVSCCGDPAVWRS